MLNKKFFLVAALLGAAALSNNAQASDDDCGIWMCLPTGFPEGCVAAHAAMVKRVSELKAPLPPFGACSADGTDNGYGFQHGVAAVIPARQECAAWSPSGTGQKCSAYELKPKQRREGVSCRVNQKSGFKEPRGCTHTERYVRILENGEQQGQTYYW